MRARETPSRSPLIGGRANFDRALATFAERYADQNERDFAAVKSGCRRRPDRGSVRLSIVGNPVLSSRALTEPGGNRAG
jgi:hypothetical protein